MLKIYQTLTIILSPLIRIYLFRRKLRGKEDPARFNERLGKPTIQRPNGKLIWIHGASVGEAISILPLINLLSEKYQDAHFLITTGTVTSANLLENKLPPRTIHQYVPVDILPYVKRFLQHWQPDLALWVESELWPNLISEVGKICPLILINGRMSGESYIKWQNYSQFIKELLGNFSLLLAQSKADATRLDSLGAANIKYVGNIKYAAPELNYDEQKLAELKKQIGGRPLWVAASTHKVGDIREEKIAALTHKKLKQKFPDLFTIIVPRHPARKDEILAEISNEGLLVALRSNGDIISDKTDIYLADTMGELGIFYRLSDIVFVGGSIGPVGGHNPLEPANLKCAIIVGLQTFNFVEITNEFIEKNAIIVIKDENELADVVINLLNDKSKIISLANSALNLVQEKTDVMDKVLKEISPYMEKKNAA